MRHTVQVSYSHPAPHHPGTPASAASEPPVGEPLFGARFGQAFKRFWRGYVQFQGRASRSEFWFAYLAMTLLTFIPAIIYVVGLTGTLMANLSTATPAQLDDDAYVTSVILAGLGWAIPMIVLSLAMLLPTYAMMWRRLHDAGFSGAFALLNLVSLGIVPIIMCILPTSPNALKYGPGAVPGVPAAGQQYVQHPYGYGGQPGFDPSSQQGHQPYPPQGQPPQNPYG